MYSRLIVTDNQCRFYLVLCTIESTSKILIVEMLKANRLDISKKKFIVDNQERFEFIDSPFKMFADINTNIIIDKSVLKTYRPLNRIKISSQEYERVMFKIAKVKLSQVSNGFAISDIDNTVRFAFWTLDKYNIEYNRNESSYVKYGIIWVDIGHNIGVELRKLRPCIVWENNDYKCLKVIPLTHTPNSDYNLTTLGLEDSYVRIDEIKKISSKRVRGIYKAGIQLNPTDITNIEKNLKI